MDETIKTKRPAVKPRGGAYGAASISLSKGREKSPRLKLSKSVFVDDL